jgi:hypothetical protein
MAHDLGNGWTATKNGKTFDVYKDGVFQFNTARLKFAKSYAKAAK